MEKNRTAVWLTMVLIGCTVVPAVLAVEESGSTLGSKKAAAGTTASLPASPTAMATPQIAVAEGSISGLDLQANTLQLTDAAGKVWTLTLDPKSTAAWQNGQLIKLDQLKEGEQVKTRYWSKDGKQVAKSIEIAKAYQPSTPTTNPAAGK